MKSNIASPPIYIQNPRKLPLWNLPAKRIPLGAAGDYKPSIALLPDGELVMTTYRSTGQFGDSGPALFARSADGGKTWSNLEVREDILGAEPYITCTSDGTLFVTSSVTPDAVCNEDGVYYARLNRSTDAGRSWESTKVIIQGDERCGVPMGKWSGGALTRNLLELPDGTLLCGACINTSEIAYLWKSKDQGRTWVHGEPVTIGTYRGQPYNNNDGIFHENFLFRRQNGQLLNWIRVGPPSPMHPTYDGRPIPWGTDNVDRAILCESDDDGRTWKNLRDFGHYALIYPRVIRLHDGRLLMTYTQRSLYLPFGLRAMFSYDDGETWDFENDQIIIDGKTPMGAFSGGGFGNTVQLKDGKLISAYSYRGIDEETHVEVVRWSLPVSNAQPFFFGKKLLELTEPDRQEALHNWADTSPVTEDLCSYDLRGTGKTNAIIAREENNINEEKFAVKLTFLPKAQTPGTNGAVTLSNLPITDWSDYTALAIRLHNPTEKSQRVCMGVKEAIEAGGNGCWQLLDCAPGKTSTLFIDLAEMQSRISLDKIELVMISSVNSPETQTFLAGNVWLIK